MEATRSQRKQMVSPERSPVWSEPLPPPPLKHPDNNHNHHKIPAAPPVIVGKKIPVVYYLCRNRHLEHPHFVEVSLSSPDGLHLRDVMSRLNAMRGKGMAAMYSWSSKRSYKNGFVWHDLSQDDLILPANGNEYVLKGSELLDQSSAPPGTQQSDSNGGNARLQSNRKFAGSSRAAQEVSSFNRNVTPSAEEDDDREFSPPPREIGSSGEDGSPEIRTYPSPPPSPSSAAEYILRKPLGAVDASTQTDDCGHHGRVTCIRGMSTEDSSEIGTPPPQPPTMALSSEFSSFNGGGRTETLESLIRSDGRKAHSFKVLQEEEIEQVITSDSKPKPANMLIQLITCGSIAVKDHRRVGLVPCSYSRARPSPAKFTSPEMMEDLDCSARFVGLRSEEKEYFSGSLIETKKKMGGDLVDGVHVLKRSNSYNAERSCKSPASKRDKEAIAESSSRSKCLPRGIKISSSKQPKHEAARSPLSEGPRRSSSLHDCSLSASLPSSRHGSKRFDDASSAKCSSMRLESFREDEEKVIKIEENLFQELGL